MLNNVYNQSATIALSVRRNDDKKVSTKHTRLCVRVVAVGRFLTSTHHGSEDVREASKVPSGKKSGRQSVVIKTDG